MADIYLTALDPADDEDGVAVDKIVDLTLAGVDVDSADTTIIVAGETVNVNGVYQAGYAGTLVGNRYQFAKDGADWYETYIHEVIARVPDGIGGYDDLTYSFDTETLLAVANTGFEAPHETNAGFPRAWLSNVSSEVGAGTLFGRVNTPANWTPPEGDYALILGRVDISLNASAEAWLQSYSQDIDITIPGSLVFGFKVMSPSNIRVGFTWELRVLLDYETVLWTRDYTVGDEDETEEDGATIDISGYTGVHNLSLVIAHNDGSLLLFDGGSKLVEYFEQWPEVY